MKTWFVFDVTNYLGFTERCAVFVNGSDEGAKLLEKHLEYAPMEIKYVGCCCYNPELGDTVEHFYTFDMSAIDGMLASGMAHSFSF